jgi:hypothetical protein
MALKIELAIFLPVAKLTGLYLITNFSGHYFTSAIFYGSTIEKAHS